MHAIHKFTYVNRKLVHNGGNDDDVATCSFRIFTVPVVVVAVVVVVVAVVVRVPPKLPSSIPMHIEDYFISMKIGKDTTEPVTNHSIDWSATLMNEFAGYAKVM
ncbi:hypothetical protein GQX74_007737 [Glossina fuscipes]|nr:hypothetical protein GQX74_007737 [Glossina fuscipes]